MTHGGVSIDGEIIADDSAVRRGPYRTDVALLVPFLTFDILNPDPLPHCKHFLRSSTWLVNSLLVLFGPNLHKVSPIYVTVQTIWKITSCPMAEKSGQGGAFATLLLA